jgi:uncharacterized protein YbbC (DUF1343 family)
MTVKTGLDILISSQLDRLKGKRIGILCHQASINSAFRHIIELLSPFHRDGYLSISAIFGPQHGLWGHTQDNMIEWEGFEDPLTGSPVFSLYGKNRKPTPEMLKNLDLVLIDLVDIGSRYYTFIWSMSLMLEACSERALACIVLDRPDPINGMTIEGTVLDTNYRSFVGLYPLPMRHGMTIGEIANYLQHEFIQKSDVTIIPVEGWNRNHSADSTRLPWVLPSPNMPHLETATVYPGMCLLEGSNISEGRGTTRPFEIFGAPWIDGWKLCNRLQKLKLPGVFFRPIQFLPTFQKFENERCQGGFIHITNTNKFKPVITATAILNELINCYPENFEWKKPPYEYEYEKLPFDILAGNSWLREMIETGKSISEIEQRMRAELEEFKPVRNKYLLYD